MFSPSNVQSQKKGVDAANSGPPLDFSTGISILLWPYIEQFAIHSISNCQPLSAVVESIHDQSWEDHTEKC